MAGIYIHIPFCKQACSYCDFYFVTRTGEREDFVNRLIDEVGSYAGTRYVGEPVRTLYIGGGTPSLLSIAQLEKILRAIHDTFDTQLEEVTLEMNPDDVTEKYLAGLKKLGINRASMGVQSFNENLLKFMNRAHNRQEALRCMELLSGSGFKTYTVDLIYGNPGQTLQALEDDVDTLLSFEPVHVSAYSLTIEPKTRLGKQVDLGRIAPPEDDIVAEHFELINRKFREAGIYRYEVSNYSRKGFEALHNSNYWSHENYIGMGPGAHSFWWDEEALRWQNAADLNRYLSAARSDLVSEKETLSTDQLAEERIMMGLRTREGIPVKELKQDYRYDFNDRQLAYLEERQSEGKLEFEDHLRLTDKGIVIADSIILDLLTLR